MDEAQLVEVDDDEDELDELVLDEVVEFDETDDCE